MSDSIDDSKTAEVTSTTDVETPKDEPKLVPEAYKTDMFKYKEQSKALAEELQTIKNERERERTDKLKENEDYKSLFEDSELKRIAVETDYSAHKQQFVDSSKLNAVVQAIGGFKKDEYTKFIDPSKVSMTEGGTIDTESLKIEADRIRQTFPELLRSASTASLPNTAPRPASTTQIKDLSPKQLRDAYTNSQKK
jgi:hypothetical protein